MEKGRRSNGTRALVTGASSAVGRALAARLAAEGHDLVLVDRDPYLVDGTARDLRQRTGVDVQPMAVDLARPDALGRVLTAVGDLDIRVVAGPPQRWRGTGDVADGVAGALRRRGTDVTRVW